MEVSIQTQKKPRLVEHTKEREQRLRQLTLQNKELLELLKRHNQELSRRLSRRHSSSKSEPNTPDKASQKSQKELSNAYRQIEMYKSVLTNLRAKEVSSDSGTKIKALENKLKEEDVAVQQLQREVALMRSKKQQLEKETSLYANENTAGALSSLSNEIKRLKEKLKTYKRSAHNRQELEQGQHQYFLALEKELRVLREKPQSASRQIEEKAEPQTTFTQMEWRQVHEDLAKVKKTYEELSKRIQVLNRQRNKEQQAIEQAQLQIKEKTRVLGALKNKTKEVHNLLKVREKKSAEPQLQNSDDAMFIPPIDASNDYKRWTVPNGYLLEHGKIYPESAFFSDKELLKNSVKTKVTGITLWTDGNGFPSLVQFTYTDSQGKIIVGSTPPGLTEELTEFEQHEVVMTDGDYLLRMNGFSEQDVIYSLSFVSKFGKNFNFGSQRGEMFRLEGKPREVPSCLCAALRTNNSGQSQLCYVGVELVPEW